MPVPQPAVVMPICPPPVPEVIPGSRPAGLVIDLASRRAEPVDRISRCYGCGAPSTHVDVAAEPVHGLCGACAGTVVRGVPR